MPRTGGGIYVQPASDVNPPIAGTTIDPVAFAAAFIDFGNEITNSVDRLGRSPMQAVLPMGGFRIANVGTPVSQTDAARLADFGTYLPPGAIGMFSQKIAPLGWAVADGSAISRTTYPILFASYNADGLIYGTGDGLTTFNLPDYRGAMLRSWDNGKGFDPARVFGSYQADMFASHTHIQNPHTHIDSGHTHTYLVPTGASAASAGGTFVENNTTTANTGSTAAVLSSVTAVNQSTGGAETAPKNYACLICIRLG